MIENIKELNLEDYTEAIPGFPYNNNDAFCIFYSRWDCLWSAIIYRNKSIFWKNKRNNNTYMDNWSSVHTKIYFDTLKYIELKIDTLVDIKPTNVSIFITLI